ncbi:MAG: sialidase family protein [Draconibacterium sp.]
MKTTPIFFLLITILFFANSCTEIKTKSNYEHVKDAKQVIVYAQEGRYAAWPANNGAFIFSGDEILVGFTEGTYKLQSGHNIDKPYTSWLARSTDGGETWNAYDPENFVGDLGDQPELKKVEEPIDFQSSGFVMRIVGCSYHGSDDPRGHFFYSYDRGVNWNGPFSFGDLLNLPEIQKYGLGEITPRTDYVVTGTNECLVLFSARVKGEFGTDRLFCMKTVDGGQSFQFMGWVVKPFLEDEASESFKVPLYTDESKNPYATQCRAVMSQTFMLEDGKLLSVMRRKWAPKGAAPENWVDAYASVDGGKTWKFQSKVGDAGEGNGNPPALAVMADGRLCAVFGERQFGTILAAYSSDEGKTWSEPQILMDGFWSEDMELDDMGYPRVVTRSDGKMVAIFYYSTKEHLHHIHATIWDPNL